MKLLIHDLSKEEWDKIKSDYNGWEVISDNGQIKPCVGCFGCWTKSPGECVIKDGYNRMGELIHKADEVVVMSKLTYGGFSSFVKNVFDRSISWVLPFFEMYQGEMHHQKRYAEDKPLKVIFRSSSFTEDEKHAAKQYVDAVCRNFHANLSEVIFEKCRSDVITDAENDCDMVPEKVIMLNCSMRSQSSNSLKFLKCLSKEIKGEYEIVNLIQYSKEPEKLINVLEGANRIVLGMPLYVDGIPSAPLRIMEMMEKNPGKKKIIYTVSNMGFYESIQIRNLMAMVKNWSNKCGYIYGGGLAIGAGEMLGNMMKSENLKKGPTMNVANGFERLGKAINDASTTEDIYVEPYKFPRGAYIFMANLSWPMSGHKNGLKKRDLYRQV